MRNILPRSIIFGEAVFTIPPTKEVLDTLTRSAADIFHSEFPDASEAFVQGSIAIGKFESYLGGAGSFAPDGIPSWNFGAVHARPSVPDQFCFKGGSCFAKFPTQKDGILFWKKIMPTAALNALQKGDAFTCANEMEKAGYYNKVFTPVKKYEAAIVAHSRIIATTLGEEPKVFGIGSITPNLEPEKSGNLLLAGAALLTGTAALWYASKG